MAFHDLSNQGDHAKVVRIVRPFCNLGVAVGGDEVKLDAKELDHPAVFDAVMTREDVLEAERKAEEARRVHFAGPNDSVAKQVDAVMKQAIEERRKRKAKDKVEDVAKAKDEAEKAAAAG